MVKTPAPPKVRWRRGVQQQGNDRYRPFFLDLFGGAEGVARALRARGFACKSFDISQGPLGDLSRRSVVRRICKLLRAGQCRGVMLAPPCTTFSIARRPALRSMLRPWGLEGLSDKDTLQLAVANRLIQSTLTILHVAEATCTPWILENPLSSLFWRLPQVRQMFRRSHTSVADLHMCGYGTPWRKATKLLCSRIRDPSSLAVRCFPSAGGLCAHSGRRHAVLQGRDQLGVPWTRRAQEYPRSFCTSVATQLIEAGREHEFASLVRERQHIFQIH